MAEMFSTSYDPEVDRITERELVDDIMNRVKIGSDITFTNDQIGTANTISKNTNLTNGVLKSLIMHLSNDDIANFSNTNIKTIVVNSSTKTVNLGAYGSRPYKVIETSSGIDYVECMSSSAPYMLTFDNNVVSGTAFKVYYTGSN